MRPAPVFPSAPKDYDQDQINQFQRVLTLYFNQVKADSDAASAGGASISNVISTPTTIAADTSYPVISYLTVTSDLTVNGNLMVIG